MSLVDVGGEGDEGVEVTAGDLAGEGEGEDEGETVDEVRGLAD